MPWLGGWNWMVCKVPSNPTVLWFSVPVSDISAHGCDLGRHSLTNTGLSVIVNTVPCVQSILWQRGINNLFRKVIAF